MISPFFWRQNFVTQRAAFFQVCITYFWRQNFVAQKAAFFWCYLFLAPARISLHKEPRFSGVTQFENYLQNILKRKNSIEFKEEVVGFIDSGNTVYKAVIFFNNRDKTQYDKSLFYQWYYRNRDRICKTSCSKCRASGGGRKTSLGRLEDVIASEIVDLRKFIANRAYQLAKENNIDLIASEHWVSDFLRRNGFSLRLTTNLTILTDVQLVQRAVDYMKYLHSRMQYLNLGKTLLMGEIAVYFEDARTQTVDFRGAKHVVMNSTGFASMRITCVISVWADGRKAVPLVIHKGKETSLASRQSGPILYTTQSKAWVNQDLLISWIDCMFPFVDVSPGKCIVWDSRRAHIAKRVKEHCHKRNIELIGGFDALSSSWRYWHI